MCVTTALALLLTGVGLLTPAQARTQAPAPAAAAAAEPVAVRLTQANLLSGQPDGKFKADLAKVFATDPDFITYNEVPFRPDELLAPKGFALWRTPGRYSGTTPVAWRTDRWTVQAQGTLELCNRKGRSPGQKVDWGIRYANWVTLAGVNGERISVVSAHLPPKTEITEGLTAQSLRRLGALSRTLQQSGPVLFGGDFNFHYKSSVDYPRELLAEMQMTPTYDVLGTYFPTGDHHGNTIDYVFMTPVSQFSVLAHRATEMNSDHDAVTADLTFTPTLVGAPVTFVPGKTTNLPSGDRIARRAVLDLMVRAIDNAPRGSGIHLTTTRLADGKIYRALRQAVERGVRVQFVARSARPNKKEQALFALLGARVKTRSWAVRCSGPCRSIESRGRLPLTQLLVSTSGASKALRIDIDQPAAFSTARNPTTAEVTTREGAYDSAYKLFLRLVGRQL
ncbi:MAG: hypothetical protein WKF79_00540 [Nocardioides sp.]